MFVILVLMFKIFLIFIFISVFFVYFLMFKELSIIVLSYVLILKMDDKIKRINEF